MGEVPNVPSRPCCVSALRIIRVMNSQRVALSTVRFQHAGAIKLFPLRRLINGPALSFLIKRVNAA